jgi:putative DNA primase/helicase
MKVNNLVTETIEIANGRWPQVLSSLGIQIDASGKHSPCPVCGGVDRFRFDDIDGRGTWFCNQCDPSSGDGLNLVSNACSVSPSEAANQVSDVLGYKLDQMPKVPLAVDYKKAAISKDIAKRTKAKAVANRLIGLSKLSESKYLLDKGISKSVTVFNSDPSIKIGDIKFTSGDICLPIKNDKSEVVNCQLINAVGDKRFLYGGQKSNCFHFIEGVSDLVAIAEGYATALTINLVTNSSVYVAFDCGNLKNVALIVKEKHPKSKIIICGDNDLKNKVNSGKVKAEAAANAISAIAKIPTIQGDWNDFFQINGAKETKKQLLSNNVIDEIEHRINNKQLEPWELERLAKIGEEHAHIVVGARHRVMLWKHCPVDGVRPTFESVNEFQNYFLHLPTLAGINQGKAWMSWAGKVFYPNGIGYYPDIEHLPLGCFNLFRGWGSEPEKTTGLDTDPDLAIIKLHLKDVICDGHEDSYLYLIHWLAQMIQQPAQKPPVAILLKSVEGSGKGTLYELLKAVLGKNAYQVNGNGQLVGRFNSIIDGRLLVFGDEVDMTDKRQYDKLKSLISEKTQSVERKGLEPEPVRVLARFIFTGNHDHLIKAGTNERRWLVLEPSPAKQDDRNYWESLYKSIRGNAPSKLLYHLLNLDLSNFDVRKPPVTQGLIDQKLASLKLQEVWIYEQLSCERPFDGQARITAPDAINRFIEFSEKSNEPKTQPQARSLVGKMMSAAGLIVIGRSDRGNGVRFYDIPPVADMREAFAKYLKHKPNEIF